ncbi:hypothetical protein HOF78_01830 [Candidatus Woesearchaeota archaeon]|nr:hypothetical protein [Candidatus Woesearchaeota archaeon]
MASSRNLVKKEKLLMLEHEFSKSLTFLLIGFAFTFGLATFALEEGIIKFFTGLICLLLAFSAIKPSRKVISSVNELKMMYK